MVVDLCGQLSLPFFFLGQGLPSRPRRVFTVEAHFDDQTLVTDPVQHDPTIDIQNELVSLTFTT